MDGMLAIFSLIAGLVLRIGLPVALTILAIWLLRKLDEHWKQQAGQVEGGGQRVLARNPGCWDMHHCSAEMRAQCLAYANPDKPCWQIYRSTDGRLRESCLGCDVFQQALAPVAT